MSDASGWHPDPQVAGAWAYWDGIEWLRPEAAPARGAPPAPVSPPPPTATATGGGVGWAAPSAPTTGAGAPGWWQASDGNWYPPSQQPGPTATPQGYAPGPTYGAPPGAYGYGYGYPVAPRTNGYAIAAMVLGIVWIYGIGSVLALVFGYKSRREIDRSNGAQTGRGMAVAGIVLGWIGVVGVVLVIALAVAASDSARSINSDPSDGRCNSDRYLEDPDC